MKKNLILLMVAYLICLSNFAQIYTLTANTNGFTYIGTNGSLSNLRNEQGYSLPSWSGYYNIRIPEDVNCYIGNSSFNHSAIQIDTLFIDGTLRNTAYHTQLTANVIIVSSTGAFRGKSHSGGRLRVTVDDLYLESGSRFETPSTGANNYSRMTWNGSIYVGNNVTLNTGGAPNNLISKWKLNNYPGSYPKYLLGDDPITSIPDDISTLILNSGTTINFDISEEDLTINTNGNDLVFTAPFGDNLTIFADDSDNDDTPSTNLIFGINAHGSIQFGENQSRVHSMIVNTEAPQGISLTSDLEIADSVYNPSALMLLNGIVFTSDTSIIKLDEYSFIGNSVTNWSGHTSGGSDSSYINGPISKEINFNDALKSYFGVTGDDFYLLMPVGKNGILREAGIGTPTAGLTTFQVEYFDKPHTHHETLDASSVIEKVSVHEYWNIDRMIGSANACVVLTYNENSGIVNDFIDDAQVMHFDGSKWEDQGNDDQKLEGDDKGTLTSNLASSFSPFTFGGSEDHNLPVELTFFSSYFDHEENLILFWETASEINNSHFEIEASVDNHHFNKIGLVEGYGNSDFLTEYDFKVPKSEIKSYSFFRLKQVDFDGSFEYSSTIIVYHDNIVDFHADMFPNPCHDSFKLTYNNNEDELEEISIYNNQGQLVCDIDCSQQHKTYYTINTSSYEIGIYYVKIKTHSGKSLTEKLLVSK